MTTNTITYRTQRDAVKDARIALWGDLPLSKRPFLRLEVQQLDGGPFLLGTFVTAHVNGRDVVIEFDNYGRHQIEVLPR